MAVTRTVGGVTCGYWAIGSRPAAMPPSRTMTIEMTHARTGRSMKKRASTTGLLSGLFGLRGVRHKRGRHIDTFRIDNDARPNLLKASHDHLLPRLQAVGDLPEAGVQRP